MALSPPPSLIPLHLESPQRRGNFNNPNLTLYVDWPCRRSSDPVKFAGVLSLLRSTSKFIQKSTLQFAQREGMRTFRPLPVQALPSRTLCLPLLLPEESLLLSVPSLHSEKRVPCPNQSRPEPAYSGHSGQWFSGDSRDLRGLSQSGDYPFSSGGGLCG